MVNRKRNSYLNSNCIILQEALPSGCKDPVVAEMKVNKLISRKRVAEREKVQILSELCIANDEAKDIAVKIEQANPSEDEQLMVLSPRSHHQYIEILRELDDVKQQICSLKLDMVAALEEKAKALMEIECSNAEIRSYSRYSEEIRSEMEEANVEQVLTDLATIEAEREIKQVEAQREAEAARFTKHIVMATSRINDLRKEIISAKKLQAKLVITASDAKDLQNEMEFNRAMDKSFQTTYLVDKSDKMGEDQAIDISALPSAKVELERAKKELSNLKEEGFKQMDEMDGIRKELIQIAGVKEQSRRTKESSESSLESLNTKLHKAMSKMETASMAEKRADAIVTTLSAAQQQLKSDVDAVKREAELITQETKAVRMETEKTKSYTQSVKERLQNAMKELKAVKVSEANALEELKAITESTMSDRAISSLWSSTITISKFEYYYLNKQAKADQVVADKKVAAAQAWMEVVKAENKVRSKKAEDDRRENWALVPVEGKGVSKPKKALLSKKSIKNEVKDQHEEEQEEKYVLSHDIKLAIAMPRRSLTVSGISVSGASRRLSTRRSSISLRRRPSYTTASPALPSKKMGKVMDKLAKFLEGRR